MISNHTNGRAQLFATRWPHGGKHARHLEVNAARGFYLITLYVTGWTTLMQTRRAVVDNFGNLVEVRE